MILAPLSVSAATYYVATYGNDANDGKTESTPFLTIKHAATIVKAGDQVVVRSGRYHGPVFVTSSGTQQKPIVFSAYPDESPVIVGSEVANYWPVYSGQIYQTAMSPMIRHVIIDGQILNKASSLQTMEEGDYYQVSGTLYVWCPGGGSPAFRDTGIIRLETSGGENIVSIFGSYVEWRGFTFKYSSNRCVSTWGADNVKIDNCNISFASFHGIYFGKGSNCEVVNSEVHSNVLRNWPRGSSLFHDSGIAYYGGSNGLIMGCRVYRNNGEGLGTSGGDGESAHTGLRIEKNIVYDNYSVNIWIDHGSDVVVDGNFVYVSGNQPSPELLRSTPAGILCAEETGYGIAGDLKNGVITNNIVTGCREGFGFWQSRTDSGLKNFVVAHNTFVNNKYGAIIIEPGDHTGTIFQNNIFYQSSNRLVDFYNPENVIIDYNSWYHETNDVSINWGGTYYSFDHWQQTSDQGAHGRWQKPVFKTGSIPLKAENFRLDKGSPCRNRGKTMPLITEDFWSNQRPRGSVSDIGAHESAETFIAPIWMILSIP